MTHNDHPTFAFSCTGAPTGLLLLDAGPDTDSNIWDQIISRLEVHDILTIIVSYPEQSVHVQPHEIAHAIVQTLNQTHSACPSINRTVLVGSKSGCLALQIALSIQVSIATDLVLIDPDPLWSHYLTDPCAGPTGTPVFSSIPVTTILHGASSTTAASKCRLQAQESDLSRFPDRRQILAGRSSTCIVSERPDVVVDAILRHLTTGRSGTHPADT